MTNHVVVEPHFMHFRHREKVTAIQKSDKFGSPTTSEKYVTRGIWKNEAEACLAARKG